MSTLAHSTSSPSSPPCPAPHGAAIAHVLVCLDRSASSGGCLPYARFVAEAFGAKITLLHVMPSPLGADALDWELAKREADQYLNQAQTTLGVASEGTATRLVQGSPAEQILAAAREIGADLIILSSQGESGSPDLGSVAAHVLASAGVSVLLSPPPRAARIPPRRILVPLDGSLRSESVLPLVAELARPHGSEVLLVHVVTDPTSTAMLSEPEDMRLAQSLASRVHANAEGYLERIRARLVSQGSAVKTFVVRRAEERQALVDVALEQSADILVLTAHGSTCNAERTFGSVASYLLAHAHLPIFVLQDMPREQKEPVPGQGARVSLSVRPTETD